MDVAMIAFLMREDNTLRAGAAVAKVLRKWGGGFEDLAQHFFIGAAASRHLDDDRYWRLLRDNASIFLAG
jgi:hypothetical protein